MTSEKPNDGEPTVDRAGSGGGGQFDDGERVGDGEWADDGEPTGDGEVPNSGAEVGGVFRDGSVEEGEDSESLRAVAGGSGAMQFSLFEQPPGLLHDREAMVELINAYGLVRAYFIARPGPYRSLQRSLDQARWGMTYDRYLTRLAYLTVGVTVVGVLLGGALSWVLSRFGLFAVLASPVGTPGLLPEWLVTWLGNSRSLVGSVLLTLGFGTVFAVGTWYGGVLYPGMRADSRKREIDFVLPDAIVFMYALSESGMTLVDVIERLADSEDAYGEVAAEFDVVRRDITLYGNDLYTSLRNARNLTPSSNLEKFLDDLLSLHDSGGDVTSFLGDQTQTYLDRAKEEQADLLNLLAIMSEVFIVAFVATPLFLVVILMVISLLGGSYLTEMAVMIYVGLPLGFFGFGLFLSVILDPYLYDDIELDVPEDGPESGEIESEPDDGEYAAFRRIYRLQELRRKFSNPIEFFREKPLRALLVTVPVTLLYLGVLASSGLLPLTVEAWTADPVVVTNQFVVVPFLLLFTPLMILHELERRRQDEIAERFPDTLNVLSSANSMGIPLSDALDVVSQWSSGYYARELRTVRNDLRWSQDTSGALLRFANRLGVPSLTRTLKLIAEGRRTTTDLSTVLRIAAEDTRNRFRLIRKRRQEMLSYIAVVIVSYLVFIGVILMLDVSYLSPIAELSTGGTPDTGRGAPTAVDNVPIDTYRLLFFHAVIVQAIGTGLISGILTDNKLRTGLKYSIVLIVIAAITFGLL